MTIYHHNPWHDLHRSLSTLEEAVSDAKATAPLKDEKDGNKEKLLQQIDDIILQLEHVVEKLNGNR